MHTTSQLPDDLLQIKKQLGLPLVKFESPIFLAGFHQSHLLENPAGFADALIKHYKMVGCSCLLHHYDVISITSS